MVYNFRAGIHSNAFADGFAANGQTGDQGRHAQGDDLRPGEFKIAEDPGCDGSRGGAGHDTADIAHHVIADGADTLGIAQQTDGLLGTHNLSGSHGMEGLFISRGNRHTDDIENNTHKHDGQQDEKCHNDTTGLHNSIGHEADGAGDQNGGQENGNDPFDMFVSLPFGSFGVYFTNNKFSFKKK